MASGWLRNRAQEVSLEGLLGVLIWESLHWRIISIDRVKYKPNFLFLGHCGAEIVLRAYHSEPHDPKE